MWLLHASQDDVCQGQVSYRQVVGFPPVAQLVRARVGPPLSKLGDRDEIPCN